MPTNRTNISINRTLIILLGIIIAFLLTMNARSFYSAEAHSFPKNFSISTDKSATLDAINKIGKSTARGFMEKVSSL